MSRITCRARVTLSSGLISNRKKPLSTVSACVSTESQFQVQTKSRSRDTSTSLFDILFDVLFKFLGSPFSCKVVDAVQAIISGHNLKMGAVKRLISFTVESQTPSTNCDVIVTPPSGIALPITIEPIGGKYNVSFVPTEVGRHNISVLVDGESIKGSPFACNIYDVTKVNFGSHIRALKCSLYHICNTYYDYGYRFTYQASQRRY